jgi:hypothetical protein
MQGKTQVMNHVILAPGIPARMHFDSYEYQERDIRDSITGLPKKVTALVFHCDTLDGQPVSASYSTISDKEASNYRPYLTDNSYRLYDFTVTIGGTGFARERTVRLDKRV